MNLWILSLNNIMNFSSLKNIPTMYLYFGSVICFVLASSNKDTNVNLYYLLMVIGVLLFVFGLFNRTKKQ